jgi:signal peptidase II
VQVKTRAAFLGSILPIVLLLDIVTKRWAMDTLRTQSLDIFGGLVPLTLAFNRGAAFGISIGDDPRWFFIPVTILAMVLLAYLLVHTDPRDRFRLFALSLVFSGALGNLVDRVRWSRGVVDFIGPINLGFMDWPIFNVADMAISCGAVALAISFWMEDEAVEAVANPLPQEGESPATD